MLIRIKYQWIHNLPKGAELLEIDNIDKHDGIWLGCVLERTMEMVIE